MKSQMFSKQLTLFLFYIFIQFSLSLQDCVPHKSNLKDNEKKLLEKISPLQGTIFQLDEYERETKKYHYDIAICSSVDPGNDKMKSVGAVQSDYKNPKANVTLGRIDEVGVVSGTNWIQLTYYSGDKYDTHCNGSSRMTNIMIVCDPNVEKGDLRLLLEQTSEDKPHCFYLFELASKFSCTVKEEDDTIGGGGIFCILFFTTAGLYVLGGFLYQRLIVGAKGLEQIPNYTFWRSFGNLQADGCDFLCRCGPRHESQAYRGIDDRLPKETDRDDQLLSM